MGTKIVERDIVEKPIIFVDENNQSYAYSRGYTNSGLPYYTPPENKNTADGETLIEEIIFLPISNKEFIENKQDYFFGFRFLIQKTINSTINLIDNPFIGVSKFQITYEICRIRYYPLGEKSIKIEKMYDALFPTVLLNLQLPSIIVAEKIIETVDEILDRYCGYYVDKKI